MNTKLFKVIGLSVALSIFSLADAKGFGSNNSRWGGNSFFGSNNGCNDWPEWTPMYWMEEMSGNNDNCYGGNGGRYGSSPYQYQQYPQYQQPYSPYGGYAANPYMQNPYARRAPSAYDRRPTYGAYPQRSLYGGRGASGFSPFGNSGMTSFPGLGGSNFSSPFSGFSGASSPFSSFGGGSPWSGFGTPMASPLGLGGFGSPMSMGGVPGMSPMGGLGGFGSPMSMGGMPGMSPMGGLGGFGSPMSMGGMPGTSPMGGLGGFGSPMSPMSMGTMGMPGMSPMNSFGGSPFGGSGFSPFR